LSQSENTAGWKSAIGNAIETTQCPHPSPEDGVAQVKESVPRTMCCISEPLAAPLVALDEPVVVVRGGDCEKGKVIAFASGGVVSPPSTLPVPPEPPPPPTPLGPQ
jgi:hypothetical protein